MQPNEAPGATDAKSTTESLVENAGEVFREVMLVAQASLDLLRAELRLAKSSTFSLVWLGLVSILFGVGTWLATMAALAVGIYQLSGNLFFGIGVVAMANLLGIVWVLVAMRRCWHDLSFPRTRALLLGTRAKGASDDKAEAAASSEEST